MNLFDGIQESEKHTKVFVRAMETLYDFRLVGWLYEGKTAVFKHHNTYYHVSDNGYELNVCTVNKNDTFGIPFTSTRGRLNPGTIAYRVRMLIVEGYDSIDWNWVMTDEAIDPDITALMYENIDW